MTDVWVYQGKELKVFASAEAAQKPGRRRLQM